MTTAYIVALTGALSSSRWRAVKRQIKHVAGLNANVQKAAVAKYRKELKQVERENKSSSKIPEEIRLNVEQLQSSGKTHFKKNLAELNVCSKNISAQKPMNHY